MHVGEAEVAALETVGGLGVVHREGVHALASVRAAS